MSLAVEMPVPAAQVPVQHLDFAPQLYRFSAEDYHRMGEAGIITSQRTELLDGIIIAMSPIGIRHAMTVSWLIHRFAEAGKNRYLAYPGNPLSLDSFSEPQPDLMLIPNAHRTALPSPAETYLLVEVSDSTLRFDQTEKRKFYAEAKVTDYWIVNLQTDAIEVFREPADGEYRQTRIFTLNETVSPLAFPDVQIAVADIIPPR